MNCKAQHFIDNKKLIQEIESNFIPMDGSWICGRVYSLNGEKLETGLVAMIECEIEDELYNDQPAQLRLRKWNVTLVETAGAMQRIHGHSKYSLHYAIQRRDYCHCNPNYPEPEYKCLFCLENEL